MGEQDALINVLNAGKGLYIENPDLGYAHSGTQLYQMLGATYLGDGNSYTTGNVQSVTGQAGTFVAGLNYDYMYQQTPDNYVDYIGSNGGTILFRSQEDYGRVICYGGTSNSYRSIYSTFNLGALRNGTYTKLQLVQRYMNYLLPIGVSEKTEEKIFSRVLLYPNPSSNYIKCNFSLNAKKQVQIKVYDTAGRIVRTIIDKELDNGDYEFIWDGNDETHKRVSNGTYIFVIESPHGIITKTISLIR